MANVQILEQLLLLQEQVKFFTIPRTFLLSVAILVLFQVILLAYNVYAHPLAKIPGPKLAAMSKLYELWHDLGRKGRYVFEIERMHAKYGSIVRISPGEVSIRDPDFFEELYVNKTATLPTQWREYGLGTGVRGSTVFTSDPVLHNTRRRSLEPYFSRKAIDNLEPIIIEQVENFMSQLRANSHRSLRFDQAALALTSDINGILFFEQPVTLLQGPIFWQRWYEEMWKGAQWPFYSCTFHTSQCMRLARLTPSFLAKQLIPCTQFLDLANVAKTHMAKIKNDAWSDQSPVCGTSIFRKLIFMDLPRNELTDKRLAEEAMGLLCAGSWTPARVISTITYHVLDNSAIASRLRSELIDIDLNRGKSFTRAQLEAKPYLRGCVKEGLRLSVALLRRIPRVLANQQLHYGRFVIPKNTPCGMSIHYMHTEPGIFPEPLSFRPERWLGDYDKRMDSGFVPFLRGSHACIGINLAQTMIYVTIAMLFGPSGPSMALFEPEKIDLSLTRDAFIALSDNDIGVPIFVS